MTLTGWGVDPSYNLSEVVYAHVSHIFLDPQNSSIQTKGMGPERLESLKNPTWIYHEVLVMVLNGVIYK